MAIKTQQNDNSVEDFLNSIEKEQKRKDAFELLEIFKEVTGETPKMWGDSIVGFGSYHYKYASGQEGDWMLTAFSPRKANLTVYIMSEFASAENLLKKLGKHKTTRSCLAINKLSDVDTEVLKKIIAQSVKIMREKDHG